MKSQYKKFGQEPGPLCRDSLAKRLMLEPEDPARLTITPLLKESDQVWDGHIDLRLGYEFIVPSKATWDFVGHAPERETSQSAKRRGYVETWIRPSESFMLHPGQLVLAATLEYICLPNDVSAQVESKSSWGRLGIIVATATLVHPGFKGVLTLELYNAGELPIELKVGMSIAQLWLVAMSSVASPYHGRFRCPVGPEIPEIQNLYAKIPTFNFKRGE